MNRKQGGDAKSLGFDLNLGQRIASSGGKELIQVTYWIDARASAVSVVIIRTLIP